MKQQKKQYCSILWLAGMLGLAPLASGYELDPDNRWQIRDYYSTVYPYLAGVEMGWTGNYTTGDAGTVSGDWQEAVRVRVNYYRRMAGLGNEIVLDPLLDAKCQQAALMMSENGRLSHDPSNSWTFWTQDAYDAASNGNLSLGSAGPDAVDGYMADFGTEQYPDWNNTVGHRRWILFPQSLAMGNGDVPGNPATGRRAANTLWVFPQAFGPRPQTRDDYIAWPPRGYVPNTLVWSRWSFSYPNADFSQASVTMQSGGQSLPVELEDFVFLENYYPESTLVWKPDGMSSSRYETWPAPGADQAIQVSVKNVRIDGESRSFDYTVIIFDPESAGPGEMAAEVTKPKDVFAGIPARFSVHSRAWSEGVQGRILGAEDYEINLGAEDGINPFIVSTSGGYPTIQTARKGSGQAAFHLTHTTPPEPQTLTFPDEFIVSGNSPKLGFLSSLGWASSSQFAHVDIKAGSEDNWQSIWSRSGPVQTNTDFELLHLDLSAYIGRTIRIRFRYEHAGGLYYPGTNEWIGWAIDDIHLTGVQRVTSVTGLEPEWNSNEFTAFFEHPGDWYIQARDIAFDGFGLAWGPVTKVEVKDTDSLDIPLGSWQDNALLGWSYGATPVWAYSLTTGYTYTGDFPWLYTQSGWIQYLQGSVYDGLWFYHPQLGYCYTRHDYGGWFIHSPFDPDSWQRFFP